MKLMMTVLLHRQRLV